MAAVLHMTSHKVMGLGPVEANLYLTVRVRSAALLLVV